MTKISGKFCVWMAVLFLMSVHVVEGQVSWSFEVGSGARLGWWQYNGGDEAMHVFSDSALDYSHVIGMLPLDARIGFSSPVFDAGVGFNFIFTDEDVLRKHQLAANVRDRYSISDGFMEMWFLYGYGKFSFIRKPHFRSGPMLKLGYFELLATHPAEGEFGQRYFWELLWDSNFRLGKHWLSISPSYQLAFIETTSATRGHRIFSLGLHVGFRW